MQINIDKRYFILFVGIILVLGVVGIGMAFDPNGAFHEVSEVDWSSPIDSQLKISGSESGWGGWNYIMSLTSPGHAMMVFPESNLGFGMHSNGNFYWSYLGNYHPMTLTRTGFLSVRSGLTVGGKNVCLADGTNCPANNGPSAGSYIKAVRDDMGEWCLNTGLTSSCSCGGPGSFNGCWWERLNTNFDVPTSDTFVDSVELVVVDNENTDWPAVGTTYKFGCGGENCYEFGKEFKVLESWGNHLWLRVDNPATSNVKVYVRGDDFSPAHGGVSFDVFVNRIKI